MAEPSHSTLFLSPATQARIAREPARLRTGLMLMTPDFMHK
jgi:hypothetical protein